MSNEELVSRIQNGEDLQTELYQQNVRLIEWVARKYISLFDLDDLKQEAAIAMMEAAKEYSPEVGTTFATFAINAMSWKLYKYIQDYSTVIRIPYNTRAEIMHGDPAADTKLLRTARRAAAAASLDAEIDGTDGMKLSDTIEGSPDFSDSVIDTMAAGQDAMTLWSEVDALEGIQGDVIRRKFQQGMTIEQIAKDIGTDSGTVRYANGRALRNLGRSRKVRHIAEELGYIQSLSYCGSIGRFKRTLTSSTEDAAMKLIELQEQAMQLRKQARKDIAEADRL